MKHVNTRKFKAVGGVFSKASRTKFLFFALLFVALTAMNALAQPEPRVIILDHDTVIDYRDTTDGCFNYILQPNDDRTGNEWRKATGARLRAGRPYLHTPFDVTKRDSADLSALLAVEGRSFSRLFTQNNIIHLTSYILLLIILWVVGLRLYRWTRRTDVHRKQMRPWRDT